MNKKISVVDVAQVEAATSLAGLSLEATISLAEIASAVKD